MTNPRWPPNDKSSHTFIPRAARKMILVSQGMFSGSRNSVMWVRDWVGG